VYVIRKQINALHTKCKKSVCNPQPEYFFSFLYVAFVCKAWQTKVTLVGKSTDQSGIMTE
jgi:hypothetical protein